MFNIFKKKVRQCSLCAADLIGNYWKIGRYSYCADCFSSSDICALCGTAGRDFREIRKGRKICPACLESIPVCGICKKHIIGKYHRISEKDLHICNSCFKKSSICFSCGNLVHKDLFSYPDRRLQCSACFQVRVASNEQAAVMLDEIVVFFRQKLKLELRGRIDSFNLVDAPSLKRLAGKRSDLFGTYMRKGGKNHIYCLVGLPRELMYAVLAHELTHMWQAQNCIEDQTEKLREGFAEWGAYKFCLDRKLTEQAAKMRKGTSIYARGLERMLSWEKKNTYHLFLDKVKRNKGLLG